MCKKAIFVLVLCTHVFSWCIDSFNFNTRLAVGPAWNQFFSNEMYTLTPLAIGFDVPDTKFFNTTYNLMPYAESRSCLNVYKYCNIHFLAAGGAFKRGNGGINYITNIPPDPLFPSGLSLQNARRASVNTNMSIIDISGGPVLYDYNNIFSINPVVGYMRVSQSMAYAVIRTTTNYAYKTKWQGPYVGINVSARIACAVSLRAWYKRIMGAVASCVKFSTTASVLDTLLFPLPDATSTQWKTSMRGDVFHLEGVFNLYKVVHLGIGIEYFRYYNHREAVLTLKSINTDFGSLLSGDLPFSDFITGGVLKKISLQQVMWTFFVELQF